jgi:flagellar hook assembly protein FlgD
MQDARQVNLKVYNTAGRLVSTLLDGWQEAGSHEVTFDGSKLSSGLYFVRMQTSGSGTTPTTVVRKMILMK